MRRINAGEPYLPIIFNATVIQTSPLNPQSIVPGRRNLIAVLDWGLGHASRSLALAQRLRAAGEEVIWTSAGRALAMLQQETEEEEIYELPPYAIRYASSNMYWNMAQQLPRIYRIIKAEQKAIQTIIQRSRTDRLISDNRFGCYSESVPSIFLSHQLHPIIPWFGQPAYRFWLRPFAAFWVPDNEPPDRLSGRLSNKARFKEVHYLGYLSRLEKDAVQARPETPFQIGVLLSGPEPQRTYLEEELLPLLQQIPGRHQIVRGLAGSSEKRQNGKVLLIDYADGDKVKSLLQNSELIVARSGYSSLMDMQVLGVKQALLIPTPGQTEQVYLAQRAQAQGWAKTAKQGNLKVELLRQMLTDQVY